MGLKSTLEQWTVDRVHHEVHEGEMFLGEFFCGVSTGVPVKMAIFTGAKFAHYFWEVRANGPLLVQLYEDSNCSTTGGVLGSVNLHRAKGGTAYLAAYTTSVVSGGTLIKQRFLVGHTGGGVGALAQASIGGDLRQGTELILDSSSVYHFVFTNTSGQPLLDMEFVHEFYEEGGV